MAAAADDAIAATGRFVVALSGGSTPERLFKLLAADPFAGQMKWAKTHILFADERCVPPDNKDSNFGMACRLLLDHVQIPYENIHRMAGEKDPAEAAAEYDRLLNEQYPKGADLVLLGMGEDGHTASLFPGTEALKVQDRLCVANFVPRLDSWRLTMTLPYLNRSFEVMVLVSGKAKAELADRALVGMALPPEFPVQMVQPASGRLVWMMDVEAAGMDEEGDEAAEGLGSEGTDEEASG